MKRKLKSLANSLSFNDTTPAVVRSMKENCDGGGIGGNCNCND